MVFVVGLFLFVLGLLAIVSTFKKPKNEDEAKKLEMFKKHKWKYRIGGYFLMSIGFVLMFPDTLPSTNTTQSTVQTSNQQAASHQREVKLPYGSSLPGTKVRKALISFYKHHYPDAILVGHNFIVIDFPNKNNPIHPLTVGVVNAHDNIFEVECFLGMRFERNLGPKECLSPEDKEGRSVIAAFYHIYKIKKPSEAQFIKDLRHKCLDKECRGASMTVESAHKRYHLALDSSYISSTDKDIHSVGLMVE